MKTNRIPTLQTVADAAKVSRSAVSLAMRNDPALRASTRERIQKIAAEIGYRPNPMVSALMAHLKAAKPLTERGTIAFLTSHKTRDGWRHAQIFRDYFGGASEQASRLGYRLEEFWLKEPGMTAARMTLILETRGVAGVIVAPFPAGRGHLSLDVSHFACVALGYSMTRPKLHRAANHHIEIIRLALRELHHRGYRRIALALHRVQDRRVNHNFSAGYLTFQQNAPPSERLPICHLDAMGTQDLQGWMKQHRPQAMILGSPEDLAWFRGTGVRVPEEVGVALVGDLSHADCSVAGVDQRGAVTGAAAVDLIVGQIHRNERGIPENAKITLTEGVWVDGATVRNVDQKNLARNRADAATVVTEARAL